jgi:hypothetical protein
MSENRFPQFSSRSIVTDERDIASFFPGDFPECFILFCNKWLPVFGGVYFSRRGTVINQAVGTFIHP